jgi:hypothetical protein
MTGVHPPFQSNWKTWFEIPKMGAIARAPFSSLEGRPFTEENASSWQANLLFNPTLDMGVIRGTFPTSPHQEHPHSILFRPDDRTLRPSRRVFQRVPKVRRHDG